MLDVYEAVEGPLARGCLSKCLTRRLGFPLIDRGPCGEGHQLRWTNDFDFGDGEDLGITLEGVDVVDPTNEARLRRVRVLDVERTRTERQVLFVFNREVECGRDLDGRRLEILMILLNVTLGEIFGAEEGS